MNHKKISWIRKHRILIFVLFISLLWLCFAQIVRTYGICISQKSIYTKEYLLKTVLDRSQDKISKCCDVREDSVPMDMLDIDVFLYMYVGGTKFYEISYDEERESGAEEPPHQVLTYVIIDQCAREMEKKSISYD